MPLAIATQGAPKWISMSRPNRYTTEWISVVDLTRTLRAMSAAKRCHQSYTVVFEAEVSQVILRRDPRRATEWISVYRLLPLDNFAHELILWIFPQTNQFLVLPS